MSIFFAIGLELFWSKLQIIRPSQASVWFTRLVWCVQTSVLSGKLSWKFSCYAPNVLQPSWKTQGCNTMTEQKDKLCMPSMHLKIYRPIRTPAIFRRAPLWYAKIHKTYGPSHLQLYSFLFVQNALPSLTTLSSVAELFRYSYNSFKELWLLSSCSLLK